VVPLLLAMTPVKTMIDVGCGVGTWTAEFLRQGVDAQGIDGDYVNRDLLRIPQDRFTAVDLRDTIRIERRFDLAICLEVAEHLPESRGRGLVRDLIRLAPLVLFSAAIPGQGGLDHINEQYLSYWAKMFGAKGYKLLDLVRPEIWNNQQCEWWYRQNAVLFAAESHPLCARARNGVVDVVHPDAYHTVLNTVARPTLGFLVGSFPASVRRSLRSRLTKRSRKASSAACPAFLRANNTDQ
jgi:hypothetical protein